jgi:hypothetical protein
MEAEIDSRKSLLFKWGKRMCTLCQQNSGLVSRRAFGLFAASSAALLLATGADAKDDKKKAPP